MNKAVIPTYSSEKTNYPHKADQKLEPKERQKTSQYASNIYEWSTNSVSQSQPLVHENNVTIEP